MNATSRPSDRQREVARLTAAAFQVEKPSIIRFYDENQASEVGILVAPDSPEKGVTAYATIGLSDHPLLREGKEFGTRVELLGACSSTTPGFENVLSTLAFCVINSKWFCAPGIVFPDVVSMYGLSATMSDIFFASPFLWEDRFGSRDVVGRNVAWLMAIPISKTESELAQKLGPAELERALSEREVSVSDVHRASVV